ncbi:MAG: LacI family DNA-binding transcriptional regulator [Thermoanaerobacteraceae bacterium]|nr:LacI family DNA-binding transcriptional regulator [Thermoanaerobacteraceae bacterium]
MVNIKEVAKRANTSIATVSRVINNSSNVKEETRQKVLKAIKELNYQPLTRQPVVRENQFIGLVVPDVSNPFFGKMARGLADAAGKFGYSIILCNIDGICGGEDDYLLDLIENRVDGVIYASSHRIREVIKRAKQKKVPLVMLDREIKYTDINTVTIDNNYGAFLATEHLISLGHKKIAFIGGPKNFQISEQRRIGYEKALEKYGLSYDEELVYAGIFTMESGFKAMKRLLEDKKNFSALIAANDLMAIGAINCLSQHGISVPDDVSVVGFDDISIASTMEPKLTTVAYPIERISERSLELLMKQISNEDVSPEKITLFPKLAVRGSTKSLKE